MAPQAAPAAARPRGCGRRRAAARARAAAVAPWALAAALVAAAGVCGDLPPEAPVAVVGFTRYHSGFADNVYMSPADQRSSQALLPPMAWVFQDYEATNAACPVLLGVCGAAVIGFFLQHCLGRCFSFQRIAVFYPPTLKAGEFWRLLTHATLHSDLGHVFANLLHILNTLDLEGIVRGSGYPASYALGSQHVAGAAAVATAYGALVGSVTCFGAMFEGASALCFGLDGALLAACGLLLGASADPSLEGFLKVRGCYALIHMGLDVLRGCSAPRGSVGNVSHFAGFLGGFSYVLIAMPQLGGRPTPTVRCPWGRGYEECFAFFSPEYVASVQDVRQAAMAALGLGAFAALANAFVWHRAVHASADGYSVLVKPPGQQRQQGGHVLGDGADLQAALRRSQETYAEEQRRRSNV